MVDVAGQVAAGGVRGDQISAAAADQASGICIMAAKAGGVPSGSIGIGAVMNGQPHIDPNIGWAAAPQNGAATNGWVQAAPKLQGFPMAAQGLELQGFAAQGLLAQGLVVQGLVVQGLPNGMVQGAMG